METKKRAISVFKKYWWVLLILILAYTSLAFFDLVPPTNSEYCKLSNEIDCIDLTYDQGELQFAVKNRLDYGLTDTKIILENKYCNPESQTISIESSGLEIYSITCNSSRVLKGAITFSYINSESGLRHLEKGKFKLFPKI